MEEIKEIDGKLLLKELVKRAWVIIMCAVIFATGALIYSVNFVDKTYKAEITMYVVNKAGSGEGGSSTGMVSTDLAVALQMTKSYVKLIESERVLDKVVEQAEMTKVTAADIRKMMTVEILDETEVFTVKVVSRSPKMSADIANAIAAYAPAEVYDITKGCRMEVVDQAKVPTSPYAPNHTTTAILGALIGAAGSAVLIVIFLVSDTRIKSKEDLETICKLPVLGTIPDFAEIAKRAEKTAERKEIRRN